MLDLVRRRIGRELLVAVGLPSMAIALAGVVWVRSETRHVAPGLWGAVLAFLLVLAVAVAGVHLLAVRVLVELPLARVVAALKRAEEGDFLLRVPVESFDEIGELARSFNTALAAITNLHALRLEDERSLESLRRELALKAELEEQHRLLDAANQRLEARLRELTLLSELGRTLNATLDLDELLRFVTEHVGRMLGGNGLALLLLDEDRGDLVVRSGFGMDRANEGARVPLGEGVAGRAAQARERVLVRDTRGDSRFPARRWTRGQEGSVLAIPLLFQGRCEGALDFFRPAVDAFADDEIQFLDSVASQVAMAIANARLHQRTVALTLTDPLTGLHNRRSLFQRLEMELERSERFSTAFSVAVIDIDHFNRLNEAHGHLAGDAAIRGVGRMLEHAVRRVDTLARWGGEEFVLALPRADRAGAVAVADKLRELVAATPVALGSGAAHVTISVGVASFPEDARELGALVDSADAALFAAKRRGRNVVAGYAAGMREDPARRRDVRVTGRADPAPPAEAAAAQSGR